MLLAFISLKIDRNVCGPVGLPRLGVAPRLGALARLLQLAQQALDGLEGVLARHAVRVERHGAERGQQAHGGLLQREELVAGRQRQDGFFMSGYTCHVIQYSPQNKQCSLKLNELSDFRVFFSSPGIHRKQVIHV